MASLPAPRLVTTDHTLSGESTFLADGPAPRWSPFPNGSSFSYLHSRLAVPVSNITSPPIGELSKAIPRPSPSGVVFCTTDIPPGLTVPMHRTLSLDYCVVLSGEIVLILENEETTVKAGEFIVQRGTKHSWINRGLEVCRIAVVMVGSEKVALQDGTVLGEEAPKRPGS